MKKKLLIGGGVTALVVAIVAIVFFAQGGDYFKGYLSYFSYFPTTNVELAETTTPRVESGFAEPCRGNICYVSNYTPNADCNNNPVGSKECPLNNLEDAMSKVVDGAKIYVAEGSYNGISLSDIGIDIKGGYDNTFSSQDKISTITGSMTYKNVYGEISGFTFRLHDNSDSAIDVNNDDSVSKTFKITDNKFYGGFSAKDSVYLNGKNIDFENNYFEETKSRKSIVRAIHGVNIAGNNFYKSSSEIAIINVVGSNVINNLITHSDNVSDVISADSGSLVSNNTIADNNSINGIVISVSNHSNAYNNLLINNPLENNYRSIAISTDGNYSTAKGNGFENTPIPRGLSQDNFSCISDIPIRGRGSAKTGYELGYYSNCKNKGIDVPEVTKDAFGTLRAQGPAYDIGFYEFPEVDSGVNVINLDRNSDTTIDTGLRTFTTR